MAQPLCNWEAVRLVFLISDVELVVVPQKALKWELKQPSSV